MIHSTMNKVVCLTVLFVCFLFAYSAEAVYWMFDGVAPQHLLINGVNDFNTSQSQFTSGSENQGWWSPTATNNDLNDNYFVGNYVSPGNSVPQDYNNFFSFYLGDFTGVAQSAQLILDRYNSVGLPVTYDLYDVSTPPDVLNNNVGPNASIFNDLGSGTLFGSITVADYALPDPLVINLNSNAIAAINNEIGQGYFSIGGTLTPASIPEPSTFLLLGAGLAGVGLLRRRFKK